MTDSKDLIVDAVVSQAESIEDLSIDELDDIDPLEPLEVKVVSSLDGTVREIICVVTVGGPHIEVNVTKGTVSGSWGGETHTTHVNNDDVLDYVHDRYEELFEITN